jgi:hypothetical protein
MVDEILMKKGLFLLCGEDGMLDILSTFNHASLYPAWWRIIAAESPVPHFRKRCPIRLLLEYGRIRVTALFLVHFLQQTENKMKTDILAVLVLSSCAALATSVFTNERRNTL